MRNLKKQKGITIITLVIIIIVLLILTTVTITSTDIGTDFRRYSLMRADISILEDKIIHFYRQYGELPIGNEVLNLPIEIENGNTFYEINLAFLSNTTLNLATDEDKYIVDSVTFEVYYLNGIEYEGEIYYTD